MIRLHLFLLLPFFMVVPSLPSDAQEPAASKPENETEVLAFVRENHAELADVLGVLKSKDPVEFHKAIAELGQVSRNLAAMKIRNPKRFEVELDVWKTRSRVELLAAQLAGSPSEELRSQLHTAIEARIDAEIRQRRLIVEQAEATAKRARASLQYLETDRAAIIEQRYRALLPKKPAKTKKTAESKSAVAPSTKSNSTKPANSNRENQE
jgi:hypothetical protein